MSILYSGRIIEPKNLPSELFIQDSSSTVRETSFELPKGGLQLDSLKIDFIHQALRRTNGNRSKAAKLLGLSREAFVYRMRKYEINAIQDSENEY